MSWTVNSADLARARQSVRAWGARGDGTTDDTAAFTAALAAYAAVYVPPGNYVVSNLTLTGQRLFGDGNASLITQKTGSSGTLLDCGETVCQIEGLTLVTAAGCDGIRIPANQPGAVRACHVNGPGAIGINVQNAVKGVVGLNLILENVWIGASGAGFSTAGIYLPENAEYVRVVAPNVFACATGVLIEAGNVSLTGGHINGNVVGIKVVGTPITNNAHGLIDGCFINHNSTYGLWFDGVTNGQIVTGCNIYEGPIYCRNSHLITILGGIADVTDWYLEGGVQRFRGVYCPNGYGNAVHHSYHGVLDDTQFVDCEKNLGAFLDLGANQAARWDGASLQSLAGNVGLKGVESADGLAAGGAPVLYAPLNNAGAWTASILNGTNQYLSRASETALQAGAGVFGFSILATLGSKSAGVKSLVTKWLNGSGSNLEYDIHYEPGNDHLEFQLGDGSGASTPAGVVCPAVDTLFQLDCWYDPVAGLQNIRVNLGTIATGSFPGPVLNGAALFAIGRAGGFAGQYWPGKVARVGMWKGSLPPAASLWNRGNPKQLFSDLTADDKLNLVNWWDNTEAAGAHVESVAGRNLTNNNSIVSGAGPAYSYYSQAIAAGLTTTGKFAVKSPNGHFWALSVDNAGALTQIDLGTSLP